MRARKPIPASDVAVIATAADRFSVSWVRGNTRFRLPVLMRGDLAASNMLLFDGFLRRVNAIGREQRLDPERHADMIADVMAVVRASDLLERAHHSWAAAQDDARRAAELAAAEDRIRGAAGGMAAALRALVSRVDAEVPYGNIWPEVLDADRALEAAGLKR